MKRMLSGLMLFAMALSAHASKSCDELKAEIAAKIDANGVAVYTLEIVAAGEVKPEQKVVGSCDGGSSRIVYTRGQPV